MNRPRLWLVIAGLLVVSPPLWFYASGRAWVVSMPEAEEWAQALVTSGRPAGDCLKLDTIFPSYPPEGQLESYCVREFARLTHDPSACELLMPGESGAFCLGAARERGDGCDINHARDVTWSDSPAAAPSVATLEECREGRVASPQGAACCHILRVTSEPGFDDCSLFGPGGDMAELCYKQLAVKLDRPDLCDRIASENRRVICRLTVKYF